jgi:hypothetical protein
MVVSRWSWTNSRSRLLTSSRRCSAWPAGVELHRVATNGRCDGRCWRVGAGWCFFTFADQQADIWVAEIARR